MGTTIDKLNKLKQTKHEIKAAIESKGVTNVGDVFSTYPEKIRNISGGTPVKVSDGGWQPNPSWFDIEEIINLPENQMVGYPNMVVWLLDDTEDTTNMDFMVQACRTSDGVLYNSGKINHTWNKSKDKPCTWCGLSMYKTRYVIGYSNAQVQIRPNKALYVIAKGDCWFNFENFSDEYIIKLEAAKYLGVETAGSSKYHALMYYQSIKRLFNIDFGPMNGYQCWDARDMEILDFSAHPICEQWMKMDKSYALKALLGVDISNLTKIPRLSYYNIREMYLKGLKCDLDISKCAKLSYKSLKYIIDNAQTVTNNPVLAIGPENIAKLTEADKTMFINKGWRLTEFP